MNTDSNHVIEDLLIEDALKNGQDVRFRVSSGSMFPTLYLDDIVIISGRAPRAGETALVKLSDHWVVHRVIQRGTSSCTLRGDADLRGPGHTVPHGSILGTVVSSEQTFESRGHRRRPKNLLRELFYSLQKQILHLGTAPSPTSGPKA